MTKHKNVALDELRILAALMVLGVHTGQKVDLGDAAAVGAQGVQLFFVLSGYLAAASTSRHPEPLPYYQRRIRRILPLYWLVLVLRWLFDAVRYLAAGASAAQLFAPAGRAGRVTCGTLYFCRCGCPVITGCCGTTATCCGR